MHPNILEQLLVFRTIVDTGTFSAAAACLNKTVSTVSYTISKLEEQLDVSLFDRTQYRPTLTEFGREVYADAEQLLRRVERFEARAELRKSDHKTSIVLSIDNIFPRVVLVKALAAFNAEFPTVSIHLSTRDFDRVPDDITGGVADIGLTRLVPKFNISGFDGIQIGSTQNMLVMSPLHPLAQRAAPFSLAELEDHLQLILSRTPDTQNRVQAQLHKGESWTIPDDDTLRALVKQNIGWAYMNRHVVWQDLLDGSLVSPECSSVRETTINRFAVIWPLKTPLAGPQLRLAELLRTNFPAAFPDEFFEQFEQWLE